VVAHTFFTQKETVMGNDNHARLLRGEILTQWALLDAEAVEYSKGNRAEIINLLTTRYGFSERRATREIDRVCEEFSKKLKLAS
jgi:hypothetical protein